MKQSPIHERHLALGAKMADFGGWLMPIEYPGAGVLAEHASVRERVGLFDVSHLGKASVTGKGSLEYLNSMLTNDLTKISDGAAQYSMLCNSAGGVIDDLIVYRNNESDFFIVPNASNTSSVVADLKSKAPAGIEVENLHNQYGVIALQGPLSAKVLEHFGLQIEINYMAFTNVSIAGCDVIVCRTGYTGEYGYEVLPKWDHALTVWDALVAQVNAHNGLVCGLGARDTLRTEMGYPLHGHELSLEISPVMASASWAVGWNKGEFQGSEVLQSQKRDGVSRRLVALRSLDRGIPRADMQVLNDGVVVGIVTSGTFSPSLKSGIALALINTEFKVGQQLSLDVRGRTSSVEIVKLPFMPSHVR
ncbi:GcvT Glycine cleavage system T protein (aminomethyltransferase) [Candidatus Nanopelagicaceae bacterium]